MKLKFYYFVRLVANLVLCFTLMFTTMFVSLAMLELKKTKVTPVFLVPFMCVFKFFCSILNRCVVSTYDLLGKVMERRFYESNKELFPYCRYEIYDPEKEYGAYSIKDTKKKDKE